MTKGEMLLAAVREQMAETGTADAPNISRVTAGGAKYLLRTLTAERWAALFRWFGGNRSDVLGLYSRLIVASLVDITGAPLLTDADIPAVETWPAMTLEALAQAILQHNRMG